jgi:hypothetical protein
MQVVMGQSERRACMIIRTMVRYRPCRPPDAELLARLRELANERTALRISATVHSSEAGGPPALP